MPEGQTEEGGTKRARFSLPAWAKANGYERSIRALTVDECAQLAETIRGVALVQERLALEQTRLELFQADLARFVAKLDAIKAASSWPSPLATAGRASPRTAARG